MTDKTSFTPDEWRQLLRSVSLAGVAVTAASPSGPIGVVKEMFAAGKIVARAKTDGAASELIKAVAADLATPEGRKQATEGMDTEFAGASPDQIKARAIEALRRAAAIVDAKADSQESREFKMWLRSISQEVAEAAKEGGFLGIGGVRVSEAEQAALREIAEALGVPA
jgi:membrane-bound lytic murein transglycosylase B